MRIQAILRAIGEPLSLDWMRDADDRATAARRCARCPASAARRRPACCCSASACATCRSTPTSRASARGSGCCGRGASFEELHDAMLALTPPGAELELHLNLLRHGRRTCFARAPPAAPAPWRASARASALADDRVAAARRAFSHGRDALRCDPREPNDCCERRRIEHHPHALRSRAVVGDPAAVRAGVERERTGRDDEGRRRCGRSRAEHGVADPQRRSGPHLGDRDDA